MSQNKSDLIFATCKKDIGKLKYAVMFAGVTVISLLSIFNQSNKVCGCGSEAKQYIKSINKGQQAYYVEYGKFYQEISNLGVGINTETNKYKYQIKKVSEKLSISIATPKQEGLHSFTGGVLITGENTTNSGSFHSRFWQ